MPFDPNYNGYRTKSDVTHASVPPSCGRRAIRDHDFALVYVGEEVVGLAKRFMEINRVLRVELFKSHLDKAGATFNHCLEPCFKCEIVEHVAQPATNKVILLTYKDATLMKCAATYDAGSKFVMEDVIFTFDSIEASEVDIPNVLK